MLTVGRGSSQLLLRGRSSTVADLRGFAGSDICPCLLVLALKVITIEKAV